MASPLCPAGEFFGAEHPDLAGPGPGNHPDSPLAAVPGPWGRVGGICIRDSNLSTFTCVYTYIYIYTYIYTCIRIYMLHLPLWLHGLASVNTRAFFILVWLRRPGGCFSTLLRLHCCHDALEMLWTGDGPRTHCKQLFPIIMDGHFRLKRQFPTSTGCVQPKASETWPALGSSPRPATLQELQPQGSEEGGGQLGRLRNLGLRCDVRPVRPEW